MSLIDLSKQFLLAMKKGDVVDPLIRELREYPTDQLNTELGSDEIKIAFWINMYNACFLYLRKEQGLGKPEIFTKKALTIADLAFSLDDIEHGILRKFRWKWSAGYLPQWFVSSRIRQLAVDRPDPRIHFALNCGAQSCPAIAFYDPVGLEQQLEVASAEFVESETLIDTDTRQLYVNRIFLWYHGDFGGHKGIRKLAGQYLGKDLSGYKIVFREYDWTENLQKFS